MRKLFLILASTLTFTLLSITTYGQMIHIECMNGEEVCQGFMPNNLAQVEIMSGLPLTVPEDTYVTFRWYSKHENGTRYWDTNKANRPIPVPWLGEYTVHVEVMYLRKANYQPYAKFYSNEVKFVGKVCKP